MLTANLLPPHVPINTLRRIMSDAFHVDPQMDELFRDGRVMQTTREADGENFAAEFAHGPSICTEDGCTELGCIAYHRAITDAAIVAAYPHGFCLS